MVIAIIAILAAILFPVFARARENARKSSCQSNLKQIAMAELMYVNDYDERSHGPVIATPINGAGCSTCFHGGESLHREQQCGWPAGSSWKPLTPYTKNSKIWECPSRGDCGSRVGQWRSYGWNRGSEWRKMSQFVRPANVVMFADSAAPFGAVAWLPIHNGCCSSNANLQGPMPHFIGSVHSEGANIAFWDGHVKWVKQSAVRPADDHPDILFEAGRQ